MILEKLFILFLGGGLSVRFYRRARERTKEHLVDVYERLNALPSASPDSLESILLLPSKPRITAWDFTEEEEEEEETPLTLTNEDLGTHHFLLH
jgi:hypothetical protein